MPSRQWIARAFAAAACALALVAGRAAAAASPSATGPAHRFTVERLADGVFAVVRQDLPGLMVDANNLFIIGDRDVIVVDSNGAPAITREVVKALRALTRLPVRYVINTHWHDDHIRGNSVYAAEFPGAEFIAHAAMRPYMAAQGEANRRDFVTQAPGFAAYIRQTMAAGKDLNGDSLTAAMRASYESDLGLVDVVLADSLRSPTVLPTLTVTDSLTLYRGDRTIVIRSVGAGHTGGDLVVELPRERIIATGDLVAWPVPLVGDPQSHIGSWGPALRRVMAARPAIVVPGHGPLLRDLAYVETLAGMFESIAQQASAAVARGDSLDACGRSLAVAPFGDALCGTSAVRRFLFDMYVRGAAATCACREALAAATVR